MIQYLNVFISLEMLSLRIMTNIIVVISRKEEYENFLISYFFEFCIDQVNSCKGTTSTQVIVKNGDEDRVESQ